MIDSPHHKMRLLITVCIYSAPDELTDLTVPSSSLCPSLVRAGRAGVLREGVRTCFSAHRLKAQVEM